MEGGRDGRMDGWKEEGTDGWKEEETDGRKDEGTDGWKEEETDGWKDGETDGPINGAGPTNGEGWELCYRAVRKSSGAQTFHIYLSTARLRKIIHAA